MKAVLVIDIPNGVSLDEWYAVNVVIARLKAPEEELIHCIPYDESKTFKFVPLRPLPQKVEMDFNEYYEGMADGWNACIDEIMGETE